SEIVALPSFAVADSANNAVAENVIANQPATEAPQEKRAGGKEPLRQKYFGNQATIRRFPDLLRTSQTVQCKLTVGRPDDPLEYEADRVADHVMRMPDPTFSTSSTTAKVQRKCAACEKEEIHRKCAACAQKEEAEKIHRKATQQMGEPPVVPHSVQNVLRSSGQPLDASTRSFFEPRFGSDLSKVRVHTDSTAAESARAISAHAYTLGHHIAFGPGEHAPSTAAGKTLIAHELRHVMQQNGPQQVVRRDIFYGGAYPQRPYASAKEELDAGSAKKKEWFPATQDFAALAANSGGGTAVKTLDDLFKQIEAKGKRTITRLDLIGHANGKALCFAGEIKKDDVYMSECLGVDELADNAARISALKDRFAPGAKITLYGCDAGSSTLPDLIGSAFGVCTEGFTTELSYCISSNGQGGLTRGRIWVQDPGDPMPTRPDNCAGFRTALSSAKTDAQSKQCKAPAQPAPGAPAPKPPAAPAK